MRSRGQRTLRHQSEHKQVHHQFSSVWTSELFSSSPHLASYQDSYTPAPILNGPLLTFLSFQLLSAPLPHPPDSFPRFLHQTQLLPSIPSLSCSLQVCTYACLLHLCFRLCSAHQSHGHTFRSQAHLTDPTSGTSTGKEPSRP